MVAAINDERIRTTECNTTTVDFTPLGLRQVVADFLGGRLTSDAGAARADRDAGKQRHFKRRHDAC